MNTKVLASSLLIVFGLTTVHPQQPAKPTQEPVETVRVGTAAVQMDVVVTDKNGRRINGLRVDDFVLQDEGRPQPIDYFTAIEGSVRKTESLSPTAPALTSGNRERDARAPLSNPYSGRHIAIVFDDLSLSADNSLRTRQAITEYVNTKLTGLDMAALVSTGGSIASLQQFTNDKARLLSALRRIAQQNTGPNRTRNRFNITPAEAVRIESGDERALDAVVQRVSTESLANQTGAGSSSMADLGGRANVSAGQADVDFLKSQIRNEARSVVSQSGQDIRGTIILLTNLFRTMADLPGRKIVVLLTESLTTLGGSSEDISNQMVQLIDLARRSGVSVYALDAAGLRTRSTTATEYVTGAGLQSRATNPELSFSDFENLSAARALVAGTGGQLFANTNDIEAGIERAVADSSSYYVVGFKPALLDNKFHRLTVSVKAQPDLLVRTRRGYLAVNQDTAAGTNAELAAALISPLPHLDLPLEVVANVLPKAAEQVVITGFHVGRNYLTLPVAGAADQKAAYEVLAWVFATGRDQPVGIIKRTLTFDLGTDPDARARLKANGFVFAPAQPLNLPAGTYQIRAVIREKVSGLVGTGYQFFEVPDVENKKTVSMSSVLLTPAGETEFNGTHSFKPGSQVDLHFVIYNLPRDAAGLEQRVTLTDQTGATLMFASLPINNSSAKPEQALQGTRVSTPTRRGHYALLITLHDGKGKIDVERRADLAVE